MVGHNVGPKRKASAQEDGPPRRVTKDPFTETVFVFRARNADRLKLLYWDGTGLVMAYN